MHWSFSGGQTGKKTKKKEKPNFFFRDASIGIVGFKKVFPVQNFE